MLARSKEISYMKILCNSGELWKLVWDREDLMALAEWLDDVDKRLIDLEGKRRKK